MTHRGQFAQLLSPGLMEVMFNYLKEHPEEYSDYLDVQTSDSAFDEDQMMAGLGLVRKKQEGEGIYYDQPIQGGTKRYIHEAYSLGWQVTKEMLSDDKYGKIKEIPKEFAKSQKQTIEIVGANVLNLGTTTVTTIDGATLFNTAHPLLGGGSYSNRLNPDADMSVTSLQDMLILFEYMVNERGLKMRLAPTDIWFAPELQFLAAQIFQSTNTPFTGNNEINTMQGRLTPHVLHYLTNTRAWYVSTKELNKLKFKWREKPVLDSTDDFETKGTKHSIYFRCSAGATEWRGWAASIP